jgi:dienelactone hydrolase
MTLRSYWRIALLGACALLAQGQKDTEVPSILAEQYSQLNRYVDADLQHADQVRAEYWHPDFTSITAYEKSIEPYRRDWAELLGVPAAYAGPFHEKRIKIADEPGYTMYRVWFDAMPGVQTYGILLIPKNVDGRRPTLICQHGHGGTPEVMLGLVKAPVYRELAKVFAMKGYVTFSPYLVSRYSEENQPTEGPEAWGRDILFKKAALTGRTLVGIEARKFTRTVDYLQSLPEVDPNRIGMYGLSKGGQYTLAIAALEPRIKIAVVSGWFNNRTKKNSENGNEPNTMHFITKIHRSEYYMKNLANQFGDAELGWLIAPRPFLVENGDEDTGVHIADARVEFQRVKAVYDRLGVGDRAVFAGFHGPHRIDGAESYPFVEKWLTK